VCVRPAPPENSGEAPHGNDRKGGIYNGSLATIEQVRGTTVTARTDTNRVVMFDTATFKEYALGYAGTVYRGQGRTQTDVYALYDNVFAWNARTAYVGMTRHKSTVELYVSRDLAPNELILGEQMSRRFRDDASLAWATRDEVQERQRDGKDKGDRGGDAGTPPASGGFPREEVEALRRLDMTEYARDVHGYSVESNLFGAPNRYMLSRSDGTGGTEELEVRQASDGHWTFRDPKDRFKRGDIFDLARREGASDLETARHDVAAYWEARAQGKDVSAFKGIRSRYDVLGADHNKAMGKYAHRELGEGIAKDKDDNQKHTHLRDQNPDKDRTR